jgi:hypothetical protein
VTLVCLLTVVTVLAVLICKLNSMSLCLLRFLCNSFALGTNTTASVIAIGTIVARAGPKNTAVGFGSPYRTLSNTKELKMSGARTSVMISIIGINMRPHTANVKTETDNAVKSGMAGLTFQIIKHKKTVNSSNRP